MSSWTKFCHFGGEAFDAQPAIEEERCYFCAVEKIFDVIISGNQCFIFSVQLRVDGGELFIERLELFFGSFQLFIHTLKFFVGLLQFFVIRPQVFLRRWRLRARHFKLLPCIP